VHFQNRVYRSSNSLLHRGSGSTGSSQLSQALLSQGSASSPIVQSYTAGLGRFSIDTVRPILRRGVLLDIAGGTPPARDFEITSERLEAAMLAQRLEVRAGDVVLLRTGWARYFEDPGKFVCSVHGPGPAIAEAQWLSARGVFAVGSDMVAFEKVPDPSMPVRLHLRLRRASTSSNV
jgi:hypothetical protein